MVKNRFKTKLISLSTQGMSLKRLFPKSQLSLYRNCLNWEANFTPTHLSETYRIQLKYKLKSRPDVFVLEPQLEIPEGEKLPHIFPSDSSLCLYYPGIGEWSGDKLLSKTIVPWISDWLLHYEIWLSFGVWCGGGRHPRSRKEKEQFKEEI